MFDIKLPVKDEIEQALLGTCFYRPEVMAYAYDRVNIDWFRGSGNGYVYGLMQKICSQGKEISVATVSSICSSEEILSFVRELAAFSSPQAIEDIEKSYITPLEKDYKIRQLFVNFDACAAMLEDEADADDILEYMESSLFRLAEDKEDKGPTLSGWQQALEQIQAARNSGGVVGVSTGFSSLDNIIGGMANSNLLILAGRPGMGKTSLAVTIAEQAANKGYKVLFSSLEMSAEQICLKRQSMLSGIESRKLYSGDVSDAEIRKLVGLQDNKNFYIDDQAAITPDQLMSRARRLKRSSGLDLIVVDYLQLMKATGVNYQDNAVQRITAISNSLKQIAKELDIPVLALSQLNRGVEQREDKRPKLSDLRESGAIEQDADVVAFVYRDEYYLEREYPQQWEKESDTNYSERLLRYQTRLESNKGKADIIFAKNRHGPIGQVKLSFSCETTLFSEAESGPVRS